MHIFQSAEVKVLGAKINSLHEFQVLRNIERDCRDIALP